MPATPVSPATTLAITATVQQAGPDTCPRWTGPGIGEGLRIDRGVHGWTFTEETHAGEQIETNVPPATEFLGQGLEAG